MSALTRHPTTCGCVINNNRYELHQEWCWPCLEESLPKPEEGVVPIRYVSEQVELPKHLCAEVYNGCVFRDGACVHCAEPVEDSVDDWMEGL